MDFCPRCGSMILHGTNCNSCGCDINGFNFKKIKIGIPEHYISNITNFKKDYQNFLDLIINKNELEFTKEDIRLFEDKIINIANENFINHEKKLVLNDLIFTLNSYNCYIDDGIKLKIRSKYVKPYFNYYNDLNFEIRIDKFNKEFINKEKLFIANEFDELMESRRDYFFNKDIEDLKMKYLKPYFDYFNDLNMGEVINKFNLNFIDKEKRNFKNKLPIKYISYSEMLNYQNKNDFHFELDSIIQEHNDEFIYNQRKIDCDFFDNFLGKSLDINQRVAVLTDEDVTQIVAGAGTGKTLTIQAKVKYLIEKQGVAPEDILCISFSNSARDDLAEKLKKTIGNAPVDVRTFHSLGYKILGINGKDYEVPKHNLSNLIDYYLKEKFINNQEFIKEFVEFFAFYFNLIHTGNDSLKLETIKSRLNSLDEYDEYLSQYLQISNVKRNKEYMSTVKELIVANYLFIHNIDYEYSKQLKLKYKNYDKFISNYADFIFGIESEYIPVDLKSEFINEFDEDFACKNCAEYPSFFLPKENIYIDLISIKSDEKKAKKLIEDNLKLNDDYKTKKILIFDNDDVECFLSEIQDNLLNYLVEINEVNYENLFNNFILQDNPEYTRFKKTVKIFINLFKGNALDIDANGKNISKLTFKQFQKDNLEKYPNSIQKRNNFFLEFIEKIYEEYYLSLKNNFIDFNDMINNAVVELRNGAYIHKYKYVIVDEYQDTSHTRYNLLKEIQKLTGAKIVVVGDDWQSIYGFTGCDVNLFSQFNKYFSHSKRVTINVTRRNSQKLIDIVGKFIQKNKNQIPKKLRSVKIENETPIKLFEYMSRAEEVLALINILENISKEKSDAKILILGRNNYDIYEILCGEIFNTLEFQDYTIISYVNKPNLSIEFRTIHKSKGLESDYVVVLNLKNQINGFPNKMDNDPILDFVNNIEDENIDYPEERRLFYVALTRTKNNVYLFSNSNRPSKFVDEIKNEPGIEKLKYIFSNQDIILINKMLEKRFEVIETNNFCPKCGKGKVNLIVNNERGTSYFRCSNFCGWEGAKYHNNNYGDNTRRITYVKYAKVCPKCKKSMAIIKRNSNTGNYFLGCINWPVCDYSKNYIRGFKESEEINLNIINLSLSQTSRTRFGVYYINEYIPENKRKFYDQVHNDFSKGLIGFKKDIDEYSVNLFTRDLIEFIIKISHRDIEDNKSKLALIAVPSSKTHKVNNSIKKSIDIIQKWSYDGELQSDYDFDKEIINYKDLLKRVKDVPTAHLGEGRASCEEHVDSIECMLNDLSNEDTVYMILDDITTTGNSMRACNEILLEKGVDERNIFNIAIGATVRDDDGEI